MCNSAVRSVGSEQGWAQDEGQLSEQAVMP